MQNSKCKMELVTTKVAKDAKGVDRALRGGMVNKDAAGGTSDLTCRPVCCFGRCDLGGPKYVDMAAPFDVAGSHRRVLAGRCQSRVDGRDPGGDSGGVQASIEAALVSVKNEKTVTQNFDPWTMRLIVAAGIAYAVLPYFIGRLARLALRQFLAQGISLKCLNQQKPSASAR